VYTYTQIGVFVQLVLNQRKKTNGWLAQEVGISPSYLSLILRGQRPLQDSVERRIMEVLHLRTDWTLEVYASFVHDRMEAFLKKHKRE
jgi:hypothetical protein